MIVCIRTTADRGKPNDAAHPPDQPISQPVLGPLTRAAIFLVVTVKPEAQSYAAVRSFCGDLAGFIRAVEFRDIEAGLTCIAGFGSDAWDRLFENPDQPNFIHSGNFVPAVVMQSPLRARHAISHLCRAIGHLL